MAIIMENYYKGFVRLAEKNTKFKCIPTKEKLEELNLQITGMCYIVILGTSYNPAYLDPTILEDRYRDIFLPPSESRPEPEEAKRKPAVKVEPSEQKVLPIEIPTSKCCDICNKTLPISAFQKKVSKIPDWHNSCKQCKSKKRKVDTDNGVFKQPVTTEPTIPDTSKDTNTHTEPVISFRGMSDKFMILDELGVIQADNEPIQESEEDTVKAYVPLDYVKTLVHEAYNKGYQYGISESTIVIEQPGIDDLLADCEIKL